MSPINFSTCTKMFSSSMFESCWTFLVLSFSVVQLICSHNTVMLYSGQDVSQEDFKFWLLLSNFGIVKQLLLRAVYKEKVMCILPVSSTLFSLVCILECPKLFTFWILTLPSNLDLKICFCE